MKKIIMAVMAFLMASAVFADFGPVGRSTTLDGTGALSGNLEQWFINVKNVSGGALVDGDIVVPDTTEDDGYSVTTSATAGAFPVCVLAQACADDQMCKCQTYGLKSNVNFDVTNAEATAGQMAFISESNAGKVQAEVLGSIAASDRPIGVFLDSATSSGDVEVFLKLK